MTASVPWSVNAVEPDTWATAREAARRAGLSVGEWLEAAIHESAGETGRRSETRRRPDGDRLERRLDDLSDQLGHLMRDEPRVRHGRGRDDALLRLLETLTGRVETLIGDVRGGDHGTPHHLKAAIDRLDQRIESLFAQNRASGGQREPELERRLADISHSIETMNKRMDEENARPNPLTMAPSIAELDAAIAEITMRQATLDQGVPNGELERRLAAIDARFGLTRRNQDLSGIEHQLKTMADEMQALRRASVQAEAIETVRREVVELARTAADLAPRRSIETLERTIEMLARRIDRASFGAGGEAAEEILAALKDIRGALADVRPAENFSAVERDLAGLSEKLDQLNARGIDGATIDRLHTQAAEIRELLSKALPGDALKTLVGQIETLVRKLEQPASSPDGAMLDAVGALGRRIDAFTERVDSTARQPAGGAVLDDIRGRLEQIEAALERGDRGVPGGLEATMKSLVDKLAAAEMKLSGIDNLERGFNDLFGQIRELRASAIDVAGRAAQAAPPKRAPAEERRAPEIEPRIVPLRAGELRPEVSSPPLAPGMRPMPRPIDDDPETTSVTSASEEGADYPIEPGSGSPHPRAAASAAERVAQSEAALGGFLAKAPEAPTRTSDFIAAARRAAQAAAVEQSAFAKKPTRAPSGAKSSRTGALFIGLVAMIMVFGAVRFSGTWMPLFFHPAPSAPLAPAQPSPAGTPEDEEAAPPEKQSAMPVQDPAMAGAPPSGLVGPAPSKLLSKPDPDPEPTGSVKETKPARAPAQGAAVAVGAPAELPASIGTQALRAAAMASDPAAAYEIASRWFEGRGAPTNTAEARRWFEIAWAKGSIPAAYRLGNINEKGHGLGKNATEALRYYTIAAEGGHAKAMHNLAVMYSEGVDGKPDYKKAAQWFRMAAERNVRDSQYNLGVLYARGFGVDQNMAESYRWFALAAAQGDEDAAKKRDDVGGRLDAQSLAAVKLAVQSWTPTPLDEASNTVRLKPEWEKVESRRRASGR